MEKGKKITTYDMVVVGLMAAMVFISTYFLGIKIPTPTGTTMLKTANVICLLAAILFGGVRGGLAAGIGSMFFDLLSPEYAAEAPITFLRFFLMAFLCGLIAHWGDAKGQKNLRNAVGIVVGAVFSSVFYLAKSIFTLVIYGGSDFSAAVVATVPKIITNTINTVFAIVVTILLTPILRKGLERAGIGLYQRLVPRTNLKTSDKL